jgi:RimJ/RimL family protein N-acetyltransferase
VKNLSGFTVTFLSENLEIRTLDQCDVTADYVSWLTNPKINEFLEARNQTHSLSSVAEFVRNTQQSATDIIFGLFLRENKRHIGNVKISNVSPKDGSGEIGYLIGDYLMWGRGYATEAILSVANYAFTTIQLTRLTAGAYSANLASIRVLEKCGFKEMGSLASGSQPRLAKTDEIIRFLLVKPSLI